MVGHLLLRLEPRVHLAVGRGERGEATSKAQRARNPAHRHDRGAAGWRRGRDPAPADL